MGTYGADIQAAMMTQVKVEMAAIGWRQLDLAKAIGAPNSTLSRYLSGERDIPLPITVEIANALNISINDLAARAQARLDGQQVG